MTITDFLRARLAEREADAYAVIRFENLQHTFRTDFDAPLKYDTEASPRHLASWRAHVGNIGGPKKRWRIGRLHIDNPILPPGTRDAEGLDDLGHYARHVSSADPTITLAELEAQRRIIATAETILLRADVDDPHAAEWRELLRNLAYRYADHPEFQSGWLPSPLLRRDATTFPFGAVRETALTHGVADCDFDETVGARDTPILGFRVEHGQQRELWAALREVLAGTGWWPVLTNSSPTMLAKRAREYAVHPAQDTTGNYRRSSSFRTLETGPVLRHIHI